LKIPENRSTEAAGNVQPAVTPPNKETEHGQAPGSLQDDVSIGRVALAASSSLEPSEPKILELRQKYLDGTYSVDTKDLSAKIVDEHLEK
jgi:anti-sigma28 factor (negative regulator of flagellin synthesis)